MKEMTELESGIERLKRDSQSKKAMIAELEKEKQDMLRRSEELSQRITKNRDSFRDSLQKMNDFVKSQVNDLKMDVAGISNSVKGLSDLEDRLQKQEDNNGRAIEKLEKELVIVEKSLSDVERVKSELSRQRTFYQEAKLQLEKSLQSGMAYLRKEMDVNRREDAKKALEEFREEIERITSIEQELNSFRRSQTTRLDKLASEVSGIKASQQELEQVKERAGLLEEAARKLDSRVSDLQTKQKTASALITEELSKRMERDLGKFRKDLESRRQEDLKDRLKDFKQELQRLSSLEQAMGQSEKRLDGLGRELSELKPVQEQVQALREKAEENEHATQALADRAVSRQDFDRAVRGISKRAEELENRLFTVDKRLSTDKGRLEREILDVLNKERVMEGAQENIKKWFDARYQDVEKRLSSGIDTLTTHMEESNNLVDKLKEKSQAMDSITREVPKRLEQHDKTLTRLLDSKAEISGSLESLAKEASGLEKGLSQSLQRIASLEKGMSSLDKAKESRLDSLGQDLACYRQEVEGLSEKLSGSLERIASLEKGFSSDSRSKLQKIDGMEKGLSEHAEKLASLFSGLRSITEKGDTLEKSIQADARERASLSKSLSDTLSGHGGQLTKLSSRLTSAEKESESLGKALLSLEKSANSQLGRLSHELASHQQELRNQAVLLKEFSESGRADMSAFRAEVGKSLRDMEKGIDQRVDDAFGQSIRELREKTKGLASMKDLQSELKVLKSSIASADKRGREFADRFSGELASLQKDMESRLKKANEEQADEFRKEFGFVTKNIDSIRELAADIKIFKSKVMDAERLAKSKVSGEDFKQYREYLDSRLTELEEAHAKGMGSLGKDLERLRSSVDSGKVSQQDFRKHAQLIDTRIRDLGELARSKTDEVASDLSEFKKSITGRLEELKGSQFDDLREELKRVSRLEQDMGTTARTHEKRLDGLSQSLASLESVPGEISMLREKLDSLEELSGSMVRSSDFSSRVKELSGGLAKAHSEIAGLDKSLRSHVASLEASIEQATGQEKLLKKAHDSANKLIESRISEVDRKLSSSIQDLSKGLFEENGAITQIRSSLSDVATAARHVSENRKELDSLRERVSGIELASKDIAKKASEVGEINKRIDHLEAVTENLPGTLEKHTSTINKILESKEFLAESVASLKSDVRGMSREFSTSQERLMSLEKENRSEGKAREERIDELASAVNQMSSKLDSRAKEIEEFKDRVMEHVQGMISSYEKRFSEVTRHLSEKQAGGMEKNASAITGLKSRVGELEKLSQGLSTKSVSESEFVETIKSVSKRIDNLEDAFSEVDKKTTVKDAELDSAVKRALSDDKLMGSAQKQMEQLMRDRLKQVEERLSHDISQNVSGLEKGLEEMGSIGKRLTGLEGKQAEIESLKERLSGMDEELKQIGEMREQLSGLKALEEHLDSEVMSKVGEKLSDFAKSRETLESRLESLSGELRGMNDRLIEEKGRVGQLEQRLKAAMDSQDTKIREMLNKHRAAVDEEISEETAKAIKDAETGELKRKHEFENLLRKFQDMHVKTQQNLEEVTRQRESFAQLEKGLRERIDRESAAAEKRVSSENQRLKKRLDDSENLIMKLNNMISELHVRLEKEKNVGIDTDRLTADIKDELIDRMKTNEDMFDSEMDAFRKRLDSIQGGSPPAGELESLGKRIDELASRVEKSADSRELGKISSRLDELSSRTQAMPPPSEFMGMKQKLDDLYSKTQRNIDAISEQASKIRDTEASLRQAPGSQNGSGGNGELADEYDRMSRRLSESEKMLTNLNNMIAGLQVKLDSKTDMKMGLDKALSGLKTEVDTRLRTMDKMIEEFDAWKEVHRSSIQALPKQDKQQIDKLNNAIGDLSQRLESNRDEMKDFKEYVVEYMNNLVNTYEGRMRSLKSEIETAPKK